MYEDKERAIISVVFKMIEEKGVIYQHQFFVNSICDNLINLNKYIKVEQSISGHVTIFFVNMLMVKNEEYWWMYDSEVCVGGPGECVESTKTLVLLMYRNYLRCKCCSKLTF